MHTYYFMMNLKASSKKLIVNDHNAFSSMILIIYHHSLIDRDGKRPKKSLMKMIISEISRVEDSLFATR